MELSNITDNLDTLEIRQLFHNALNTKKPNKENSEINENYENAINIIDSNGDDTKLVKELLVMGKYVIDPLSTDFSGKYFLKNFFLYKKD